MQDQEPLGSREQQDEEEGAELVQPGVGADAPAVPVVEAAAAPADAPLPSAESAASRDALPDREQLVAQLKQLSADFENYRRRSEATLRVERLRGQDRFLEELVPVLVDLQAAVSFRTTSEVDALREGVSLILEKLEARLTALGYHRIPTRGELLDPTRHDALFTQVVPELSPGTIIDELSPGFVREGRVVFPAKVSVARVE